MLQLHAWFDGGVFKQKQPAAGVFLQKPSGTVVTTREQKWGKYGDPVLTRLSMLMRQGWTVVYTDGSTKLVKGWWQAGYGGWFAEGSARNFSAQVPSHERQRVSRGELRA